jgi:hypothetical protein
MRALEARLAKLEAAAAINAGHPVVTEIHRVIVGRFNPDGSPVIFVRKIAGDACDVSRRPDA